MRTQSKRIGGLLEGSEVAPWPEHGLRASLNALAPKAAGALLGCDLVGALGEMRLAQWLSPEELQLRAEARLAGLLRHAAENVSFYRDFYRSRGLAVDALRTVSDLAQLPILSKAIYRERGMEAFCAENVPAYRRLERATSGSTGEPFRFCLDRAALPVIFASHLFYDSWFGLRQFDRYVRIIAPPAAPSELPPHTPALYRLREAVMSRLQRFYENWTQRKFCLWEVDEARAEEVWRTIEDFKPSFVMGYTSTLATLADEWQRRGLRLSNPVRGVIVIAETLTHVRRRVIEQYFQAPIINRYGLREFGSWSAQSCSHSPDRFHVNTELVVCEVLRDDGSRAAPGETGRVALTDLWNYAMPLIRYETGDLAVASAGECDCGRGFPMIGQIEGRSLECLRTPSGKEISPAILGHYLFVYGVHLEAVSQYQLVQESAHEARLLVTPAQGWNEQRRGLLQTDLARLLGDEMKVTVEAVAQIPPEKSGKRPIIKVAHIK
jgi:phenylacetate-CoA ligase